MEKEQSQTKLKILNAIVFFIMIVVNVLANILPFNGVTTGEISDSYPNLFAPAGFTFLIWGVIYILLMGFVLYQFGVFKGDAEQRDNLIRIIGPYFAVSSLANAGWMFAWHYRQILLSVLLMLIILVCLAIIVTKVYKQGPLELREKLLVQLPFSVYFGWITVATIANITALLVSLGWNGWGVSEQIWTVIILFIGLMIAAQAMLKNSDIAYGLVVIWAYAGILIKHLSSGGFDGKYPLIIVTAVFSMILLAAEAVYLVISRKNGGAADRLTK